MVAAPRKSNKCYREHAACCERMTMKMVSMHIAALFNTTVHVLIVLLPVFQEMWTSKLQRGPAMVRCHDGCM
jgi:hypothetical protein